MYNCCVHYAVYLVCCAYDTIFDLLFLRHSYNWLIAPTTLYIRFVVSTTLYCFVLTTSEHVSPFAMWPLLNLEKIFKKYLPMDCTQLRIIHPLTYVITLHALFLQCTWHNDRCRLPYYFATFLRRTHEKTFADAHHTPSCIVPTIHSNHIHWLSSYIVFASLS